MKADTGALGKFAIKLPEHLDFLLIVRGLAAVSVIYWHIHGYLQTQQYWASFFIMPGRLAVWIFFMMSGYLIGHGLIYGRYRLNLPDVRRFYVNRLLRIYPISLHIMLEERRIGLNLLIRVLFALGVLSYGIYAWHGLLIVNGYFMNGFVTHLLATVILACLGYMLVERPLLRFKQ